MTAHPPIRSRAVLGARVLSAIKAPLGQTFLATVAINGLNLITGAILARALGPTGRGELAIAVLWPTLLRFVVLLGVVEAVTYHAARHRGRLPAIAGTAAGISLIQGAVLLLIGGPILALALTSKGETVQLAALGYMATISIGTLALYMMAILNGVQRFTAFNVLRVAVIGLTAVTMAILWAVDELTVESAVGCYLAGVLPTAVAGLIIVRRTYGLARPERPIARSLLAFGWRTQLSPERNPLNSRLDQLLVSIFLSPAKLGVYVVGFTVTTVLGFVSATVATVAMPRIAAADEPGEAKRVSRRYLRLTLASVVAIGAPIAVFADTIVTAVFGADFAGAAGLTRILLASTAMLAMANVGTGMLNGLGRPGDSGISGVLIIAGTGAGVSALVGPLGVEGAALGALIGTTLGAVWALVRLAQALETNLRHLLLAR